MSRKKLIPLSSGRMHLLRILRSQQRCIVNGGCGGLKLAVKAAQCAIIFPFSFLHFVLSLSLSLFYLSLSLSLSLSSLSLSLSFSLALSLSLSFFLSFFLSLSLSLSLAALVSPSHLSLSLSLSLSISRTRGIGPSCCTLRIVPAKAGVSTQYSCRGTVPLRLHLTNQFLLDCALRAL